MGIVTLKDILAIQPEFYSEMRSLLDEIKEEEAKTIRSNEITSIEGLCENCGSFGQLLRVNESLLCEDCREELY